MTFLEDKVEFNTPKKIEFNCKLFLNEEKLKTIGLDTFFRDVLIQLNSELGRLGITIFNYNECYHNVFRLGERGCIGLFNTAIGVAYQTDVTLVQEFRVLKKESDDGHTYGHGDLLVQWNTKPTPTFFLFEAKNANTLNCYDPRNSSTYYKDALKQAYGYYDQEDYYYKEKNTYIVTLFFINIYNKNTLKSCLEFCQSENNALDFAGLYTQANNEDNALWVYGKVFTPDEAEKIRASYNCSSVNR